MNPTNHRVTKLQNSLNISALKMRLHDIMVTDSLSDKESLVGDAYNNAWLRDCKRKKINGQVIRVAQCDAYWIGKHNVLVEYKYDIDMENPTERAKVLAQVIAYYRKIVGSGLVRGTKVIFIGDVNECFALHVNYLNRFVNLPGINWVAPSRMGDCVELVDAIKNDSEIQNHAIVFNTADAEFSEERIFTKIDEIAEGVIRIVPVTADTLKMGFDHFTQKILKNTECMSSNEQVGRYLAFLKGQDNAVIGNGMLMGIDGYAPVKIDERKARQFKARFGVMTKNDEHEIERMYDTLLENAERRINGSFFTPKCWVDESHRRIARVLGEDWEENAMVWDPCAGTKSLTRDYEYGNLWISTLNQDELNCSAALNTEAKKTFQFDFLNGAIQTLPRELRAELTANRNNPVVFHLNPPWGQPTRGRGQTANTENSSDTATFADMKEHGLGKPGLELTVQFLWNILKIVKMFRLTNVTIGLFSNPSWLTGDSFEAFRKEWLNVFNYDNGFAFRSEEFQGVKAGWAVHFSVWTLK